MIFNWKINEKEKIRYFNNVEKCWKGGCWVPDLKMMKNK